jgi:SARP family transcriptional regulator, regulator of embCAB operon
MASFEVRLGFCSDVGVDEVACQALMRAPAAAGNRAEALRVYARCRKLFREELGSEPSEKDGRHFLSILRSEQ